MKIYDFSNPNYRINKELDFFDKKYNITPEISIEINNAEKLLDKLESKTIEKYKKLIKKYPQIPHFKNFLSIFYYLREDFDKCFEINDHLIEIFPDYISAYLNRAVYSFEIEDLEEVEEILGPEMEIKTCFENVEEFHISEVLTYYKLAIFFLCDNENFEEAKLRLEFLKELAPESPETISCQLYYDESLEEFEQEKNKITEQ